VALVHVAIGGNVGDVAHTLARAIRAMDALPATRVTAVSPLFRTRPVGGPPGQPDFLNGAAAVETSLEPADLMARLLEIERELGRRRDVPDGPRTVDLDLLLWEERVVEEPIVTLPHPRMAGRGFVLAPLARIAPGARHPQSGETVAAMLAALGPDIGVDPDPVAFDPFGADDPRRGTGE